MKHVSCIAEVDVMHRGCSVELNKGHHPPSLRSDKEVQLYMS